MWQGNDNDSSKKVQRRDLIFVIFSSTGVVLYVADQISILLSRLLLNSVLQQMRIALPSSR
jgi:hypothetical protein